MVLAELILSSLVLLVVLILFVTAIKWDNLNLFFHKKYTYFNIFFVALYFLEQAVFLVVSYIYREYNDFLISFFALVVLSTVALQGIMMESKNKRIDKKLEEYTKEQSERVMKIREKYESNISEMRNYINFLEGENFKLIKENKIKSKK